MIRLSKILLAAVALFSLGLAPLWAEETDAQRKMKLQYYYLEALRQKQAGNYGAAIDNLYRSNSLDNNNSEVFATLSDINMELYPNDPSVAIGQMKKACELEPDNVEYKKRLARHAVDAMDLDLAVQLYEELVKKDTKHKSIYYYYLASIYTRMEKYQQAINAWDGFELEEGVNATVCQEKFKLYAYLKKDKKAFAEIDKLIKSAPRETKYIALKAQLYAAMEKKKESEKCFLNGLTEFPNDPILKVEYGSFLSETGREKEGISKWLEVLKDPEASYLTKHELLYRIASDTLYDIDDAYYMEVISQYPNEEYPLLVYSSVLMGRGDSTSVSYLRKALELNPKHEDAWLTLINYYVMKKDTTRMLSACQESVEQFPENPNLLDVYAMTQMMVNKKESALSLWAKASVSAIASGEKSLAAEVYAKRGDLFMSMHQPDSCFAMYDSSLAIMPKNIMVLNNYAFYLCEENKDLDRAERMSLQTLTMSPKSPIFLDTYAWICFKKGEYNAAMLYIQQAYMNGGNEDPELLDHYGDILYKSGGKEADCQKFWKESYRIFTTEQNHREYERMDNLKIKAETGKYVE